VSTYKQPPVLNQPVKQWSSVNFCSRSMGHFNHIWPLKRLWVSLLKKIPYNRFMP